MSRKKWKQCPICLEDAQYKDLIKNHCGHACCKKCMKRYVLSVHDLQCRYPIRCWSLKCKSELSAVNVMKKVLSDKQYCQYAFQMRHRKKFPASTMANNFQSKDTGLTTDEQENEQKLFMLAKAKGWKQCPGCGIFIERIYGCRTITHYGCAAVGWFPWAFTCLQTTTFCYRCGKKRSQCRCHVSRAANIDVLNNRISHINIALGFVILVCIAIVCIYAFILCKNTN